MALTETLPERGLVAILWVGVVVAGAFVIARTMIRYYKVERLAYDDYWLYFAFAMLAINAVVQTIQNPYTYRVMQMTSGAPPPENVLVDEGDIYIRYEFATLSLFWTVLWAVKASFLSLFYRLFDGLPKYRKWWYGVAIVTGLAFVGCFLVSILTCHPPSLYFNFSTWFEPINIKGNKIALYYATSADVCTDAMIMFLPMNLLWTVRIATKQKLGIAVVFCLGLFIMICAIVRAAAVRRLAQNNLVQLTLWSIIESTVAVIVGCLPPFKSLITKRQTSSSALGGYPSAGASGTVSNLRSGPVPLQPISRSIWTKGLKERGIPNDSQELIVTQTETQA